MSNTLTIPTPVAVVADELRSAGVRDVGVLDEYGVVADWVEGGTDALSLRLAMRFGGSWWSDAELISWSPGGQKRGVTIVHPVALEEVMKAREAAKGLGVEVWSWNIRAIGRNLIEWLGPMPEANFRVSNIEKIALRPSAYQMCIGGEYPMVSLWDIRSAYWQMMERLPSLYVSITMDGDIFFPLLPPDLGARWRDLKAAVHGMKALVNPMHGSMLGNGPLSAGGDREEGRSFCYTRKGRQTTKGFWGRYATAAWLAKRAVYELTALQAQGALYANTDCVGLVDCLEPTLWIREGVRFKLEAQGPARLLGVGVYQIGTKETDHYKSALELHQGGARFREVPMSAPGRLTYREWV